MPVPFAEPCVPLPANVLILLEDEFEFGGVLNSSSLPHEVISNVIIESNRKFFFI